MTDQRMPELSGIDVLKVAHARSPNTTCILLTGYSSPDLTNEAYRMNIRCLIEKPWDDDKLKKTVRQLLRERELPEQEEEETI